jgi:hypothetical protein
MFGIERIKAMKLDVDTLCTGRHLVLSYIINQFDTIRIDFTDRMIYVGTYGGNNSYKVPSMWEKDVKTIMDAGDRTLLTNKHNKFLQYVDEFAFFW